MRIANDKQKQKHFDKNFINFVKVNKKEKKPADKKQIALEIVILGYKTNKKLIFILVISKKVIYIKKKL